MFQSQPASGRLRPVAILGFILLAAWVFFLRIPTFGATMWNVDETIHAAIARTILDGGLLYQDAIDQRTPISYYAFAGIFRLFGENNLWAVRCFLAGMIVCTGAGLYVLGRMWKNELTGVIGTAVFAALSFRLINPGDAFSAHTEWFVIFFTTIGTLFFWKSVHSGRAPLLAVAGFLFACAALSKQPGLLDFAAPCAALIWMKLRQGQAIGRFACWLVAGFATPIILFSAYFAFHGAWHDFVFYTWTYNLSYYGPEIGTAQRLGSVIGFLTLSWKIFPIIVFTAAVSFLLLLAGFFRPSSRLGKTASDNSGFSFFLVIWALTSVAGAASGGRDFGHYYIQCLPAFSMLCAWLPSLCINKQSHACLRIIALFAFAAVSWSAVFIPWQSRHQPAPALDPSWRVARFIAANTTQEESIFVWGFHPDLYYYADRKPASRFVYATYLTGLIPWTNVSPEKDTAYAIVPGAMETLIGDLSRNPPAFIVDCSAGPNRFFNKYPIARFPALQRVISDHYVEVEPGMFPKQGFKLYQRLDSSRTVSEPLAGGAPSKGLDAPGINHPPRVRPKTTGIFVFANDATGHLQRIELLLNGNSAGAVSFTQTSGRSVIFQVPFDQLGTGRYRLTARSTDASGQTKESAPSWIDCEATLLTKEGAEAFTLRHSPVSMVPTEVFIPYGFNTAEENGHTFYYAHAPASIIYALSGVATHVSGSFGFRPAAFAATNATPTDGAEFIVELAHSDGRTEVLFRRLLRPASIEADRPMQSFDLPLPTGIAGEIRFLITPGPDNNYACDWTYWSDIQFRKSN